MTPSRTDWIPYISRDNLHISGVPSTLLLDLGYLIESGFPSIDTRRLLKLLEENPEIIVDGLLSESETSSLSILTITGLSGRMRNYDLAGEFNVLFHDQHLFYIKGLDIYVSVEDGPSPLYSPTRSSVR